ncbi:MAG: 8-oxo-dGTP diphosphatase [Verrucomicrobia bacterium]|nr:8-oxo-dGTP diphosphatase [Verrucomicrobiota bacterium]
MSHPEPAHPTTRASLCYIVEHGRMLLIRKKRGIGAGKINGPGGKVDPGETMAESAVRETREETGLTPQGLELRGMLHFDFEGGKPLECGVYLASGCTGELTETPEAVPFWAPVDALPYDEMWADDREWMPLLLAGKKFRASARIGAQDSVHETHVEVVDEVSDR